MYLITTMLLYPVNKWFISWWWFSKSYDKSIIKNLWERW